MKNDPYWPAKPENFKPLTLLDFLDRALKKLTGFVSSNLARTFVELWPIREYCWATAKLHL